MLLELKYIRILLLYRLCKCDPAICESILIAFLKYVCVCDDDDA